MASTRDLLEGMKGLDSVTESYVKLWTYYAGKLPETFASDSIRRLISKTAQDYRFRLAKIPVNALARRIGIAGFTSTRGDAVTQRLDEIRQANDMELHEGFLHNRLFVYGDAYMFVWPVTDTEDTDMDSISPDEETREVGVELAFQSPLACRAFYDAEDGRRMRFVIRRWREASPMDPNGIWRVEVWYADRFEAFKTKPGHPGVDAEDWEPYAEDEQGNEVTAIEGQNWPVEHDHEEIPIKHARTDLPYGRSELADFIGPQNIITKATATQASEIESHGWTERVVIADDAQVLDQAADAVNWQDSADAPTVPRTATSGRRRGPGTETRYTGTKSVQDVPAPQPGDMIEPVEQWMRLGAAASDTPLFEFDARTGLQLSGIARQRAEAPMRDRERQAKAYLLRFWREVYGLALKMDGVADPGEIGITWELPEVVSDPEFWQVAQLKMAAGIPTRQILMEANYTPEEIDAWLDAQGEDSFLDQRITRLASLGEAMQAIGAGATLLGIEEERIRTLVDRILNEANS